MLTSETDNRKYYLNVMKGIVILLILWSHCIQYCALGSFNLFDNVAIKVIYSFHLPLLMIICGYLFYDTLQKFDLKQLVIHRSKPLLWTIVFCGAFNYAITVSISVLYHQHTIKEFFVSNLLSQYQSLWLLWSVLGASIGVALICKKVQNIWIRLSLLALWSVVMFLFPGGSQNVYIYPYFVIGFYFARYQNLINQRLKWIVQAIASIGFVVMLFFFRTKHYIYTAGLYDSNLSILENIGVNLFRWVIGLFGCIAVLSLVEVIFRLIGLKHSERRLPISFCFSELGKKSLQVYALSVSFLSFWLPRIYGKIAGKVGSNFLAHNIYLYSFVYTLAIAVLYAVGLYFLIKLFERIKFSKVLFGK